MHLICYTIYTKRRIRARNGFKQTSRRIEDQEGATGDRPDATRRVTSQIQVIPTTKTGVLLADLL